MNLESFSSPFFLEIYNRTQAQSIYDRFDRSTVEFVVDVLRPWRKLQSEHTLDYFAYRYLYYLQALAMQAYICGRIEAFVAFRLKKLTVKLPGVAEPQSLRSLILQATEFVLVRFGVTASPSVREGFVYTCPKGNKHLVLVYPQFEEDAVYAGVVPLVHKQVLGAVSTDVHVLPLIYALSVM